MTKIESSEDSVKDWLRHYRVELVWIALAVISLWIAWEVREVTTLLLLAYALAVLLDPIVSWLENLKPHRSWPDRLTLSRSGAIAVLGVIALLVIVLVLFFGVPYLLRQYNNLIAALPAYLEQLQLRLSPWIEKQFGINAEDLLAQFWTTAKGSVSVVSTEHLRHVAVTLGATVLHGYSLTLTIINFILLPFFIFYILRDLKRFHRMAVCMLPVGARKEAVQIGGEILSVIHSFFQAQLAVCLIGALMFGAALAAVGLQSGFIIGVLTGLLNIVPYLGMGIGVITATVVALVTDPSWVHLILVWGAFLVVNFIQDSVVAPKLVGERLGLHPLVVMLAIIVGGHLMGLLGIIISIPVAASVRVLLHHVQDLDS